MNKLKRAAAACLTLLVCAALISGCAQSAASSSDELNLTVCLGAMPATLDPIRATASADQTVIAHLYENLMKLAPDGEGGNTVVCAAAKSYETDQNYDGSVTYTFRLRGAKWSDGKAVTADNFVYAWRRLADPASNSVWAPLLSAVEGYDEVRATGDTSKLAVSAKNDSTLVVTLSGECPWFLTDVCTAPAAMPLREDVVQKLKKKAIAADLGASGWCSDWSALVTNGLYRFESSDDASLTLTAANLDDASPDSILFRAAESQEAAWALYEAKEVDFVFPLPAQQLEALAQDEDWEPESGLNTCTLLFNTAQDPLSDPLVRNAFSLAADRSSLSALAGVTASPADGLVPPGVPQSEEKDFRTAGGSLIDCDPENYESACADAVDLLDKAGYDQRHGLARLECIYSTESGLEQTAQALSQMWAKVLGASVTPKALPAAEFDAALKSGDYGLALMNLTGCVNDAESFLSPWKSGAASNVVSYCNSAYDTLLSVIDNASSETARLGCLHDAESLLLEDCPLTPLYFTGTAWAAKDRLAGICRDDRGWFSFAAAVLKPVE